MRFNPSEVTNLLAEDKGMWEIMSGTDEVSRAGNEQMKLKIKGWDKNGKTAVITQYVCFPWQLKKICESANRIDVFEKRRCVSS